MMPFYLLMLAGVTAGYYAGVAILKWTQKQDNTLVPIATAVAGGMAAYWLLLNFAPPAITGEIVWAEPVLQVSTQDELNAILAEDPEKPILVDFYADWCAPCRAETPDLNKLALAGERIVVVDFDRSPALVERYNVISLPSALIFKNGREIHRASGRHSKRELQKLLTVGTGS